MDDGHVDLMQNVCVSSFISHYKLLCELGVLSLSLSLYELYSIPNLIVTIIMCCIPQAMNYKAISIQDCGTSPGVSLTLFWSNYQTKSERDK